MRNGQARAISVFSRLCLVFAALCLCPKMAAANQAYPGALPDSVSDALAKVGIPKSAVAVTVQGVNASTPMVVHNDDALMNPASVMKLYTSYAALELLGPNYRWRTEVWSDGPPVGRNVANLYLQGGGDPKLNLERFWLLLRQLQLKGVRHINGDLVVDRSRLAMPPKAKFDGEPMRIYNKRPDGLLLNYGAQNLLFIPREEHVEVVAATPTLLRIDNKVQLSKRRCGSWKKHLKYKVSPGRKPVINVSGRYAAACGERMLNLNTLQGNQQVEGLFRHLWKELDGTFRGRIREGHRPVDAHLLFNWYSPPLADIVVDVNKYSNNVMARHMFLALDMIGNPKQARRSNAARRLKRWLEHKGMDGGQLKLDNGSGLSRKARVSASHVNHLLIDAWHSKSMPELLASLPVAGVDGTMRSRLRETLAKGRARIKTGTLNGVKSMAGYVLNSQGQYVSVVFMVNHARAGQATEAMDKLLLWVAGHLADD